MAVIHPLTWCATTTTIFDPSVACESTDGTLACCVTREEDISDSESVKPQTTGPTPKTKHEGGGVFPQRSATPVDETTSDSAGASVCLRVPAAPSPASSSALSAHGSADAGAGAGKGIVEIGKASTTAGG